MADTPTIPNALSAEIAPLPQVIASRPVGKPGKAKGFIARIDTSWVWGRTREEAVINAFHVAAAFLEAWEPPASVAKYAEQKARRGGGS